MTDNNCRYLTEAEIGDVLRIQLQDTKLDLTAARARIAELEAKLGGEVCARHLCQDAFDTVQQRCAELEDWQSRAVSWMGADVAERMAVRCGCVRCSVRMKLIEEATR